MSEAKGQKRRLTSESDSQESQESTPTKKLVKYNYFSSKGNSPEQPVLEPEVKSRIRPLLIAELTTGKLSVKKSIKMFI
jgi:hypothetical protein